MKKTIPKILGMMLVFVLAFAMFGAFVPAKQVEAGDVRWSEVNNPNSGGTYATFVIAASDIIDIEVCNDGTMFAAVLGAAQVPTLTTFYPGWDAGEYAILKSTTGGTVWAPTGFVPSVTDIVDIVASPKYDKDTTLWVAQTLGIQRTINGGTTFGPVNPTLIGAETITSIDVAPDYLGAGLNAVVGTESTIAHAGRVLLFIMRTMAWTDMSAIAGFVPVGGSVDAAWAAFSPNYESDGEVVAVVAGQVYPGTVNLAAAQTVTVTAGAAGATVVYTLTSGAVTSAGGGVLPAAPATTTVVIAAGATDNLTETASATATVTIACTGGSLLGAADRTLVKASFQERAWDTEVLPSIPLRNDNAVAGVNIVAIRASIAFPADYESLSAINIFVGVTGAAADGDAFRIMGMRFGAASPSIPVDLNAHTNKILDVWSIAVSGTIDSATVIVGSRVGTDVRKSTNPTDSVPSWRGARKPPTGASNTVVALANDYATSGIAYAGTRGAGSALSSASDGSTFNGIAFVDTVIAALQDVAAASKDVLFMVTSDDGAATAESLWRTTNGGRNWERVHTAVNLAQVKVSPKYANDNTVYTANIDETRMWKSANGGDTFSGISARANITAWTMVDATTLLTGDAPGNIYTSTNSGLRWTPAKTNPAGQINAIAASPNYAKDSTILVGCVNGRVYNSTDGGVNFKRVGTVNPGGAADDMYVAFDPGYATNNIIYAGSEGETTRGIFRWEVGTSTAWDVIDDTAGLAVRGLVLNPDGVLYASNADPLAAGMRRSVAPTAPIAVVAGTFQTVGTGLVAAPAAIMGDIEAVGNALFAIDTANRQLQGYTDTLSKATTLTAPKKAEITPTKVTFTWTELPRATAYRVDIAFDAAFKSQLVEVTPAGGTPATSFVLTGLSAGTTYYWRVRAQTPVYSPWASSSFIVALSAPVLTSPRTYESEALLRPQFSWDAVTGAASYQLQLADNPFYANAWVKTPLEHTVWVWDEDLQYSTTYYWRVKAVTTGTESKWTEAVFTTKAAAAAPTYTCPVDGLVFSTQEELAAHHAKYHMPAPAPAPPAPVAAPAVIAPAYLWAIIIIGAILIIALIVLIARTRRVV